MEMLRQGDLEGLERVVGGNPAAIRFLQGRLWDSDPEIRDRPLAIGDVNDTGEQECIESLLPVNREGVNGK